MSSVQLCAPTTQTAHAMNFYEFILIELAHGKWKEKNVLLLERLRRKTSEKSFWRIFVNAILSPISISFRVAGAFECARALSNKMVSIGINSISTWTKLRAQSVGHCNRCHSQHDNVPYNLVKKIVNGSALSTQTNVLNVRQILHH